MFFLSSRFQDSLWIAEFLHYMIYDMLVKFFDDIWHCAEDLNVWWLIVELMPPCVFLSCDGALWLDDNSNGRLFNGIRLKTSTQGLQYLLIWLTCTPGEEFSKSTEFACEASLYIFIQCESQIDIFYILQCFFFFV